MTADIKNLQTAEVAIRAWTKMRHSNGNLSQTIIDSAYCIDRPPHAPAGSSLEQSVGPLSFVLIY